MLAVCEAGNDTAALIVAGLVIAAWVLIAFLVIRGAGDRRERIALLVLALVASLVGPAILFGLLAGLDGDNERLPEILATLLLPGLIGACVAVGMRAAGAARAFFIALWGAVFLPGAYVVLVISVFTIGTACFN